MGDGHSFKPDHLVAKEVKSRISDLPVPKGPWQEYHNARNSKWNKALGASAIFFGLTMYAVSSYALDVELIYMWSF